MIKRFSLPEWIMIGLTALFCIYGTGFAERFEVNGGGGWDGNGYVHYARELPRLIVEKEVDQYYAARFFPSVVVRGMMEVYALVSGVEVSSLSKATVINFFASWVALCLIGSVVLMLNIFNAHQRYVRWWVWGLFLCNFFILKMTFFYPTLTDMTALFLACLILWAYKKEHPVIFWLACILGYFTHPLLFYTGVVLWVFKKTERPALSLSFGSLWNKIITGLLIAGALVKFILVAEHRPHHVREATGILLPLSIMLVLCYLAYLVYSSNPMEKLQMMWGSWSFKRFLIALLCWTGVAFLLRSYSSGQSSMNYREFLHYMMYDAISDPLIFLVAHIVYFGPAVLLLIIFFPDIKMMLKKEDLGIQLVFWGSLIFAINSESRQLVVFWPLLVYVLAEAVADKWNAKKYLWMSGALVALLWSRFWLTLQPTSYGSEIEIYTFPQQLYFMHQGPWMTHQMYLLQAGLILLIVGLLYAALKLSSSKTVQSNPDSSC